jgi:hypothetical protein
MRMFEWCKGSDLRAMVRANIPGTAYDDWQEGWIHGIVQQRFKVRLPVDMLDIVLGSGPRPYLEAVRRQGARIETIDAAALASPEELSRRTRKYGLVTLLSLEREECLRPLDLGNPLPFVELLLNAATLLQDGGVLISSYLYCFSQGPASAHALLEPAALFQMMRLGEFLPMTLDDRGVGKVAVFHNPDTVFVRHEAILPHSSCHERVTRFCCAVRRRGSCRVAYVGPREVRGAFVRSTWRGIKRRVGSLRRG